MFPLISCHIGANSWKDFAKDKDRLWVLFIEKKKRPHTFLHVPTNEIYTVDLGRVFLSKYSIVLISVAKHIIRCWWKYVLVNVFLKKFIVLVWSSYVSVLYVQRIYIIKNIQIRHRFIYASVAAFLKVLKNGVNLGNY